MERIVIYNVICKATLYNSSFPNVRFTYVHVYRRYSVSQLVNYSIDHPIPVYTCICISHLKPLILHIESIYTLLAYRVNILFLVNSFDDRGNRKYRIDFSSPSRGECSISRQRMINERRTRKEAVRACNGRRDATGVSYSRSCLSHCLS